VALVTSDHQTSVAMSIGDFNVGIVLNQVPHNFDVSVETGGPQRGTVRLCCAVDVSSFANQILDDSQVSSR